MFGKTVRGSGLVVLMLVMAMAMPTVSLAQPGGRGGKSGEVRLDKVRLHKDNPAKAREKIRKGRDQEKALHPKEVRKRAEELRKRRAKDDQKRAERRGEKPTTKRSCDDPKYARRVKMQLDKERHKHLKRVAKIKRLRTLSVELEDESLTRKVAELRAKELLRHKRVRERLRPTCEKVPTPEETAKPEVH